MPVSAVGRLAKAVLQKAVLTWVKQDVLMVRSELSPYVGVLLGGELN